MRIFEICMGIQFATWISRVRNPKTKSKYFVLLPRALRSVKIAVPNFIRFPKWHGRNIPQLAHVRLEIIAPDKH